METAEPPRRFSATVDSEPLRVRAGETARAPRRLAEETAIAIVHNASTYAVMMATPDDVEDFAIGFSLTEGVISSPADVERLEVVETAFGLEARLWLPPELQSLLTARRRRLAGPTGCGLCGIESLEEAMRPPRFAPTGDLSVTADDLIAAMTGLARAQALGAATRAAHAAGLWRPADGLVAVREDVGRHNALDKLAGALARAGETAEGVVLLTSRVSVEMVQKAAAMGANFIAAVSAPTALAVRMAEAASITLAAVVREDGFEVFSHPRRIVASPPSWPPGILEHSSILEEEQRAER